MGQTCTEAAAHPTDSTDFFDFAVTRSKQKSHRVQKALPALDSANLPTSRALVLARKA